MPTYSVLVNDVPVGELSSEEYAALKKKQYQTIFNYASQALNILFTVYLFAVRALYSAVILTGILLFGMVVTPYALTSNEIHQMVLHPVHTVGAIRHLFAVVALITPWALLLTEFMVYGQLRGFVNKFDRNLIVDIRKKVGSAADGDVKLVVLYYD